MKLWIMSDLHLEFMNDFDLGPLLGAFPEADVCVVAGDVHNGIGAALRALSFTVAEAMPVVYVAGNHEFYRSAFIEELEKTAEMKLPPNVHFLENDGCVIGGVRFLGGTLWTDFQLNGVHDEPWAMRNAEGLITDFKAIQWRRFPETRFTAVRSAELHRDTMDYLWQALGTSFDGPTIVVTHHAPHPRSINQRYDGSVLNPAFASDLSRIIGRYQPDLWVHGHMHDSCDYRIGKTRVVCNPYGYGGENRMFDPQLVVEV